MVPIKTVDSLPPDSVMATGKEQVWWWNSYDDAWQLGVPMLMDFDDNPNLYEQYTHWLPESAIPTP
jgi:hypothetical protein